MESRILHGKEFQIVTIMQHFITLLNTPINISEQNSPSTSLEGAHMSVQRISTDIPYLDELVEGGFPSEGMFLLAELPGSGKTIAQKSPV